jgi:glycosyltransferase involved in cell wall biosynthesis
MHNFLPSYKKWKEALWKARLQFVSRLPRFHIFPSNQDTKDKLKGWVSEQFHSRTTVTYTAIDPLEIGLAFNAKVDTISIRAKFEIPENKFLVLCVGQFIDRKGRWVFLDAARRVSTTDGETAFVWLTPTLPTEQEINRIESYGLGRNFQLILSEKVGTDRQKVLEFFRIANVFVLASYVEGLPIALLEAMALGIPSISTNVYAIPEAVRHLETGILIDAGDAAALADAILLLKQENELRIGLSERGREFVQTNFDEREVAKIVLESYREAFN